MHYVYSKLLVAAAIFSATGLSQVDPGVRPGPPAAGRPLPGLSVPENALFVKGQSTFSEVETVSSGLGPRFNLDSCAGCHARPALGGSSPDINPQIAVATSNGAHNSIPPFLTANGPVIEVRFRRNADGTPDGGVHSLFVITGRSDAPPGCNVVQDDYSNTGNLSFRIPTPVFGLGLVESIPDSALRQNLAANNALKRQLGIRGRLNISANDGTVTRFGWKAQNKSLAIFSGEAYNVEIGVTNELFPNEREDNAGCAVNPTPEDRTDPNTQQPSDVVVFSAFMRFLDAPQPAPTTASTQNGSALFQQIGCAACHTPILTTGTSYSAALSGKPVNLFSDLALHTMGSGLEDDIVQGNAGPQDFRTAPLWGLGQRTFLLHDGRTRDLVQAIQMHASPGSEANGVIQAFQSLAPQQKQDLLNFLRSL
jgi:CxxC motif-containing protein (DUF1111 family)